MKLVWWLLLVPAIASARAPRPRFEPTDLELEAPGVIEVDLQVGFLQGQGPYRIVVPDLELDIGLLPNLEVDLDWTYAIEQPFDHSVPDNVWLSAKIGLFDGHDRRGAAWALGLQLGPRLAAAPGALGAGFEALVLLGRASRRVHAVLNVGGIVDPVTNGSYRPLGLEAGIDFDVDLDRRGAFSFGGSFAGVYVISPDPHQLSLTAGFGWSPRDDFSLSLSGVVGFLAGSDRYGVLLGISKKFRMIAPH